VRLQVVAELDLEYDGHQFRLAPSGAQDGSLDFTIPSLGAATAIAKFAVSWGVYLVGQGEAMRPALALLPPIRIRFNNLTVTTFTLGQESSWNLLLSALQRLGVGR